MARSKQKNKRSKKPLSGDEIQNENGSCPQPGVAFLTKQSEVIGRFLVAARDLQAGELILQESPLVVGPSQDSRDICIGCYTPLDLNHIHRCSDCGFPLCSKTCSGKGNAFGHSKQECSFLSSSETIRQGLVTTALGHLEAIAPLRCLALKDSNPLSWTRLQEMEAHTPIRKTVNSLWSGNQKNVVDVIRKEWSLSQFSEEEIHHVCGVLEVNGFEVGSGLRGLYPTAYLFAHDCIPNTKHADDQNFDIKFYTTVPVQQNCSLNVTYTYILQGTIGRRKHLKETKFFDCSCKRCTDVTELGTYNSALKCPTCQHGLVQTLNPLNPDAEWKCGAVGCQSKTVPASSISTLTNKLYIELDRIDGNDIAAYEKFLQSSSKVLQEGHYLCLSAMHCLFQLYGKIDGYVINDLTETQINRKVELCRRLLEAFDVLEPGLSKQRGIILYELQAPLMVLLQRCYQERKVGKREIKAKLREVTKCLEDSKKILESEPLHSQEHEMAEAAIDALDSLKSWKEIIDKM